jgi:CubicO group peptidase (beta-lactamase class C family)
MSKLTHIFLVFLYLILSPLAQAQKKDPISDAVKKNIQSRVDNQINTSIVVGVIDDNGTHFYSYGVKSVKSKEAVDEHSIYEIGSISKTFTGILLANMVLKGEMKLDDPLQKYLPEGVKAPTRNGESIKLVQMSNHTSSLPRMPDNFSPADPENPYIDYSEKQLYDFLAACELTRDIGSQYEYSNYAVGLLGHTLAKKHNTTYEKLLAEVITKPLGLKNTGIALSPEMKKNLALGHSAGLQVSNWDFVTLAGAGAIRSNAIDMLQYLAANMGMSKSKLYPAMQLSHKNTRKEGKEPHVGLGWHILSSDNKEIVWHNGGTGGYKAFAGFIKGENKGVVVLTNSTASVDDLGIYLLNPATPLPEIKPSIANKIKEVIEKEGIEKGINTYWDLNKEDKNTYNFEDTELNTLGYSYLSNDENDKAIAIFELNVKAHPENANAYDSMGEAYLKIGDKDKAISNYTKSVELNPANQNAIDQLKSMGVNTEELFKDAIVDSEILESYVGKYELMANFIITVTKEGNQMKAQATGQPQFDIFPKSDTEFYLKVVEAQVTFNKNEAGEIESLTLFQGGQEIIGKKLEEE